MVALCSLLLLVSAFLLFSIQPMVAKMLLPVLGGSPSVWNTAMVFYQAVLLGGYFYSHVVTRRLTLRRQLITHAIVLALPAIVLPLYYNDLHPPAGANPIPWVLLTMTLSVGLPFFVLSASSPRIQSWLSRTGHQDPYFLYAASNVGSFLGLLSYPFLIEPRLTVTEQSEIWTVGYVVLAVLFVVTALALRRRAVAFEEEAPPAETPESITWRRRLKWVFLAFIPSSQFIGLTTFLTTDIAVMPLLWVIPLAIYLLTMVIVFSKRPLISHRLVIAIFPALLALVVFQLAVNVTYTDSVFNAFTSSTLLIFTIHLVALLFGALLCHGELAKDRPSPARLTEFFLWMSIGGVLGGVFNALIAPAIFVQVVEYSIILGVIGLALPSRIPGWKLPQVSLDLAAFVLIGGGVIGLLWVFDHYAMMSSQSYTPLLLLSGCLVCILCAGRPLRFAMAISGMLLVGIYNHRSGRQTIFEGRSFFGEERVISLSQPKVGETHSLINGRVLHGAQIFSPKMEAIPIAYYYPEGPLKEVFENRPAAAKVGVVGLGIGSIALYSQPGETWTYFEIDQLVERIARDPSLFTCLQLAKVPPNVIIGDARLSLQDVPDHSYDILVIDAFSSDSIPAHLVTVEAFQLYQEKLKPNGLLAFNITNRFLDVEPLIAAICDRLYLRMLVCNETPASVPVVQEGRELATWCVIGPRSYDWSRFEQAHRWLPGKRKDGIVAWTDDYSSLLPIVRWTPSDQ